MHFFVMYIWVADDQNMCTVPSHLLSSVAIETAKLHWHFILTRMWYKMKRRKKTYAWHLYTYTEHSVNITEWKYSSFPEHHKKSLEHSHVVFCCLFVSLVSTWKRQHFSKLRDKKMLTHLERKLIKCRTSRFKTQNK